MRDYVHNAQSHVNAKRTGKACFLHTMSDGAILPDTALRLQQARESRGFRTAADAARYFGWSYHSYAQHENATRGITRVAGKYAKAFRVSEAWLLTGEGSGPNAVGAAGSQAEAQLRAALLAFGVDRDDLGRAVSAVKVFVDHPDEQSSPDLQHDQPEPSSHRRARAPSA